MADVNEVWEDNASGKWYVDKNCILCGVCVDVAGDNFKESDAGVICKDRGIWLKRFHVNFESIE